jgi:hypothetical protein
METNQFTLIFLEKGIYHENKDVLKEIIHRYGLIWNGGKVRSGLSYDVMVDIYKTFKIEDNLVGDKLVEGRSGSSGIWESPTNAVKIVVFDKSEDENLYVLPVLLIYKGDEGAFYREFILKCIGVGSEISKVIEREGSNGEFEQVFRKKKNIKMMMLLNDSFASRKIMVDNFHRRMKLMEKNGELFSNEFIEGWKGLIEKYGTYTDKMLFDNFINSDNVDSNNVDSDNVEKGDDHDET